MPGIDRTGPMGAGPMTGGARGRCNPQTRSFAGRAFGSGSGNMRGRRFRNMFWATGLPGWARAGTGGYRTPAYGQYSREQEIDFLKDQSNFLKDELSSINSRLQELESEEKAID